MTLLEQLEKRLESVFTAIQHERMQGVPILNPRLEVCAVGFIEWQDDYLGILITPWFMNLMRLPQQAGEWPEMAVGSKLNHTLPSGTYEFIVGKEAQIGDYQMCSLFSPVFEFENQEAAIATAEAALESVMDEANRDAISTRESEIQRIWHGEQPPQITQAEAVAHEDLPPQATLKERAKKPISRRDLFQSVLPRKEE
ncbi:MAG: [NiFe]-hydrogenase assembly chaperone HybE [Gammaproteobacteria bacterium]|nr:[NiFe]-hydrogenase assembly chaperone HybE [Gammaproteobacteria bacterium]